MKCLKSDNKDAELMRLGTQFYLCRGGEVPLLERRSRMDTVAGQLRQNKKQEKEEVAISNTA